MSSSSVALVFSNYNATVLIVLCTLVVAMSAYIKIATVLGIVRVGIGYASIPSAFVTGVLALALSYFAMLPVSTASLEAMAKVLAAEAPVTDTSRMRAIEAGLQEWAGFLRQQTPEEDLQRLSSIRNMTLSSAADAPLDVLVPAFIVSQLKEAFRVGLRIFLPFVVIDVLVGILVAAVGIDRQLSTSLAFAGKLLLFTLCDGWTLIAGSLLSSYVS